MSIKTLLYCAIGLPVLLWVCSLLVCIGCYIGGMWHARLRGKAWDRKHAKDKV